MFIKMLILSLFLNSTLINAQVVNTGGGGPDKDYGGVEKEARIENEKRDERIKKLEKDLNAWLKKTKKQWEACYGNKVQANSIIELYVLIMMKEASSEKKPNCKVPKEGQCLFKNKTENEKLRNLINNKDFDEYLNRKGIREKKAKNEIIQYYKRMTKRK